MKLKPGLGFLHHPDMDWAYSPDPLDHAGLIIGYIFHKSTPNRKKHKHIRLNLKRFNIEHISVAPCGQTKKLSEQLFKGLQYSTKIH